MEVRAIILLGTTAEVLGTDTPSLSNDQNVEQLMGYPIGSLDLLGQPMVGHVIDRLRSYGISAITVITRMASLPQSALSAKLPESVKVIDAATDLWIRAEEEFLRLPAQGADAVLVIRVGPYAEVDFDQLLKFHIAKRNCATSVWDKVGNPLDIVALDPSRKTEAAPLLRRRLRWNWRPSEMFHSNGYVNLLQDGEDFRRLAEDALLRRCALIPRGREVKPGIWLGKRARIHPDATVEGAAFIGEQSKVGAGTLLSGCSTIERHSRIDGNTRLSDSTVLPYSYVGRNLNVAESVVGFSQVAQVKRNLTVAINDEKLIRTISPSSVKRTLDPVRSVLARVSQNLSDRFGRKDAAELDATRVPHEVEALKEVAVPQKAQAAAASASRGMKEQKRAANN